LSIVDLFFGERVVKRIARNVRSGARGKNEPGHISFTPGLQLGDEHRFAQKSLLEFRLGRTLAVSLRLTAPSYILIEAMPQRWNSLGIA
jgi:hypothetical protein